DLGLARRQQAVGLVQSGEPAAEARERAAQHAFDPLRGGCKIGLAVERRKNGAAHESSAAKARQDRTAEPLHRQTAAVDQAIAAVDRERRFVTEIDRLGHKAPVGDAPVGDAQPSSVQASVQKYVPRTCVRSRGAKVALTGYDAAFPRPTGLKPSQNRAMAQ